MSDVTKRRGAIAVAVAGLGRSGWNMHVKTLRGLGERYRVTAVMDPDAERREEAQRELKCRSYATLEELGADGEVELVVVATPNRLHAEHAVALMEAGKHVVVEKPMALAVADADRMIAASERTGRHLLPFQNRRYEAHFEKVKSIIDSGVLGQIVLIRMCAHGFSRRWDWQTVRELGGGQLNNWGPHLIDHALQLFGVDEPEVFADLRSTPLSSGDAEDHVKLVLYRKKAGGGGESGGKSGGKCGEKSGGKSGAEAHGLGGALIEVEITSACAYPQDRWLVMGTAGGLKGTTTKLEWKWVDLSALPPRPVERAAAADRGYSREDLPWQQDQCEVKDDGDANIVRFYADVFGTLREGSAVAITPQSVRRQMRVIEQCRALEGR
jgi:predicted dehydrogenase